MFKGETIVSSTNGAGKTGFLNLKEQSWDPASHHVKVNPNLSKDRDVDQNHKSLGRKHMN